MADLSMDAQRLMREVTFEVTVYNWNLLRVRLWLTVRLIALAARVAGAGLKVETVQRPAPLPPEERG